MAESKKGVCPVCGETVGVRLDGFIRAHGYLKSAGQTLPCAGTGREPRLGVDGAFSALCLTDECSQPTVAIVWTGEKWSSFCKDDGLMAILTSK